MPTYKTDRTLAIVCTPTLTYPNPGQFGAVMTYQQTEAVPNMGNIVDRQTGNINLLAMPGNRRYTDNIDILLILDASRCVDQNGNPVTVRWAYPTEGNPPDDVGCVWFVNTPQPGHPKDTKAISVPGMSTGRISDTIAYIDDNTPVTSASYSFCMGIVLPDFGNYYITIDPVISGKGTGNPPMPVRKEQHA